MKYYMYTDTQGYWRWELLAANNRTIAVSSESYYNEQDCRHSIDLVKGSYSAPVYKR
jgi:uncharacterized protein YegP (UPF0339 family)